MKVPPENKDATGEVELKPMQTGHWDEFLLEMQGNDSAKIFYGEFETMKAIPISEKEFNQKVVDFKRGKWKDLDPDVNGIRFFVSFHKVKIPVIAIYCEYFYPETFRQEMDYQLAAIQNEFDDYDLLVYKPVALEELSSAQLQRIRQTCPLRIGFLDTRGGIEVWICDKHKEVYFLREYLPAITARIHDLSTPAFFSMDLDKKPRWMKKA